MTADQMIQALAARGVTLEPRGDKLHVRPVSRLTPEELDELRALKPAVMALLARPTDDAEGTDPLARLLRMPLDQFAREGQPVEIRVPWWPETLLFVPDLRHAEALWRDGVARERVWTAGELISLLGARQWTPEGLRIVMLARREFEGEVVGARPRLVGSA